MVEVAERPTEESADTTEIAPLGRTARRHPEISPGTNDSRRAVPRLVSSAPTIGTSQAPLRAGTMRWIGSVGATAAIWSKAAV